MKEEPFFAYPHALLAFEDTIVVKKPSCWSDVLELSGSGYVVLCSSGSIKSLKGFNEFGQVSSSKVIACRGIKNGRFLVEQV